MEDQNPQTTQPQSPQNGQVQGVVGAPTANVPTPAPVGAAQPLTIQPPPPPPPTNYQPANTVVKPVVGRRIFAAVIDLILVSILFFVLTLILGSKHKANIYTSSQTITSISPITHTRTTTVIPASNGGTSFTLSGVTAWITIAVLFLYYIVFEGAFGATIGKLLTGLRVRDEQGNKISFLKSLIRNL